MRLPVLLISVCLAIALGMPFRAAALPAVPDVPNPVCAYCGAAVPNGSHSSSCPYYSAPGGSATAGSAASGGASRSKPDMNAVIGGMVMYSVLEAVLNPQRPAQGNTQEVIAAQQQVEKLKAAHAAKAKAADSAAFRTLQQQIRWTYKEPDGPERTTADAPPGYKGLDSELEALAAQARAPFDTAGGGLPLSLPRISPTPFFGDTMPEADLRLLVEPETDPRVVDLREARTFIVGTLKDETTKGGPLASPLTARGEPLVSALKPAECAALRTKLNGFVAQRQKFASTVALASSELDVWQEQNRAALLNVAKAGIEEYAGDLLEHIAKRGAAADRLLGIYGKQATTMAADGVDVAALARKMQALKRISAAGQLAALSTQGQEWAGFMKDGLSALVDGLATDNATLEAALADPKVAAYFETEMPALKAALDLTRIAAGAEVFGKWAARKMPVIAGCELAVNQSYNALDWLLSFNRLAQSHEINGQVLASARSLQERIDDTRVALDACR